MSRPILDYSIDFWILAADSGWNNGALIDAFLGGLSPRIKKQVISLNLPDDLDSVIAVVNKIDRQLQDHDSELAGLSTSRAPPARPSHSPALVTSAPIPPSVEGSSLEQMQLGRTRFSAEERQRCLQGWLCLYCGQPGQILVTCPVKIRGPPMKDRVLVSRTITHAHAPRLSMTVFFSIAGISHSQALMLDSGTDTSFMDSELTRSLGVQLTPLSAPLRMSSLDGSFLWKVTHETRPVRMTFGNTHSEEISFLIYTLALQPVVLGLPWLQHHNLNVSWVTRELQFNLDHRTTSCFHSTLMSAAPRCGRPTSS